MEENKNPTDEQLSELATDQFEEDVLLVGGRSHEAWQEDWRSEHTLADGSVEPRIKPTTDEEWIKSHGGVREVDIAHTSFPDLPKDRQAESVASALLAVEDVYRDAFFNDYSRIYENEGEAALHAFATSAKIHDGWLERNGSWAEANQKLPFAQLSDAEKDKDLDFHRGAVEAVIGRIKDRSFEVPDKLLLKWLNEDAEVLTRLKGSEVSIEDIEAQPGGWVQIRMKDPGSFIDLDGTYPLATITQLLNGEVQTAKETKKLSLV